MTTYLGDANIFLRYLLNDVPGQFEKAKKHFSEAKQGKIKIIVTTVVFFEIIFVLERGYGLLRKEIVDGVGNLLNMPFLEFDEANILSSALIKFSNKNLDFADCYLLARAKSTRIEVLSFDKDFKKPK